MLIAVDIGNTNIHLGLFDLGGKQLVSHYTTRVTEGPLTDISLDPLILRKATDCILASVNPEAENALCNWLKSSGWTKTPLRVPTDVSIDMPVLLQNPENIGVDRLLNALAAFRRTGTSTIVVDAGTAITIDVISRKGEFMGGVIAPGLSSLSEALHKRTALLPEVSVRTPTSILGKDTNEAVTSGIYWGMAGAIEKITEKLLEELEDKPVILATGGDAKLLAGATRVIDRVVPNLTLEGLLAAYSEHLSGKTA